MASGTLPVLYISTVNSEPVVEKEVKLNASLWVEIPADCPDSSFALGSPDSPKTITIKGRGNSTWLLDKKPYTIKFNSKTEFLGMPKHKSFALLSCALTYTDWMGQTIGKDLARMIGLGWAPHYQPVELILNNSYEGLYFVFETVKIDTNRLNIYEQEDENTDPATIPYGWLVEIDNYPDEAQVRIPYGGGGMRLTYKSPEVLSDQQRQWLIDEFTSFTSLLHSDHPEQWDQFIEPHSMAKYFIIREVMNDYDGFNGSMYLHRDRVGDLRWHMGPIWDTTIWKHTPPSDWLMYELPDWSMWKILPLIFYTPTFKEVFLEEWESFYPHITEIKPILTELANRCREADVANQLRWDTANTVSSSGVTKMYNIIRNKANWIEANKDYDLNAGIQPVTADQSPSEPTGSFFSPVAIEYYTLTGLRLQSPPTAGPYIRRTLNHDGTVTVTKH